MTEFAAALNKQHRDEVASASALVDRVDVLEKRLAKIEALLARLDAHAKAWSAWGASMAVTGTLPLAPTTDPSPEA